MRMVREAVLQLSADHGADDIPFRNVRRFVGADKLSVAKHGDAVADAEHFFQLV